MARLAWCTDIHLDHLDEQRVIRFAEDIRRQGVDGVILTGDISNARGVVLHLSLLERVLQVPIYFVLGNHDYYGGCIETMRGQMKELTNMSGFLKYLPTLPYVVLSPSTAVVGHDGWYDALYGDYKNSNFVMNDWVQIREFVDCNATSPSFDGRGRVPNYANIVPKARELAHTAVQHVHDGIKSAVRYHRNIIVATHYPPFEEAHIYEGRVGSASAQPWYTSKMMGDMLRSASRAFPDVNFIVLAGHTHGKFSGQIEKNLVCHVGHANYGLPSVADVLTVG